MIEYNSLCKRQEARGKRQEDKLIKDISPQSHGPSMLNKEVDYYG